MNIVEGATRWASTSRADRLKRKSWIGPNDVLVVIGANALLIGAMWLRHGGLQQFDTLGGLMTAVGQLTALYGTFAALVGIVFLSRSPWLDHIIGTDRLVGWHRWVGFTFLWAISAHVIFSTLGWGMTDGRGFVDEMVSLLTSQPYVLMSAVGFALIVMVALSSTRRVRQWLTYETWYGIHLYAYLGIALAFLHAIFVGADFQEDPVATIYWLLLYAATFGMLLAFRVAQPIRFNVRHRFVISAVVPEGPGITSVYIGGRDLRAIQARAGQFFIWRFLTGGGWWRPHPYSLSAVPNEAYLRITVKASGNDSRSVQQLKPGTRVIAEGPYGAFTPDRLTRPGALFIAGGIGITPIRAMLESLPPGHGDLILLYRASSWEEITFRAELDAMAAERRVQIVYLVGRRGDVGLHDDPLSARSIAARIPDIGSRDIFVSGSEGFITFVRSSLRQLRLRGDQVHAERFAF